jgi:predicted transcriptional regulator
MQRVKFDPARLADFELVVEVGDVLSEEGMARARLNGHGRLTVEQQRGHEKERARQFHSELDPDTTEKLLRQASQFDWERSFPSRKGLPDEAIVQWYLHDRQGETLTVKVWLRDAEKDQVMAPVLAELRRGVQRATEGSLYL